jgi:predicted Holliday junction resolvase-like endonuclease
MGQNGIQGNNVSKKVISDYVWKAVITALLAALGWGFLEVRDIPKEYCTRAEAREMYEQVEKRTSRRTDRIQRKLEVLDGKIDQILMNMPRQ